MATRVTYHVTPRSEVRWAVIRKGAQRAARVFEDKKDAVEHARTLAKKHALGQVLVHGMNGKIQDEWTYGGDPKRSKG